MCCHNCLSSTSDLQRFRGLKRPLGIQVCLLTSECWGGTMAVARYSLRDPPIVPRLNIPWRSSSPALPAQTGPNELQINGVAFGHGVLMYLSVSLNACDSLHLLPFAERSGGKPPVVPWLGKKGGLGRAGLRPRCPSYPGECEWLSSQNTNRHSLSQHEVDRGQHEHFVLVCVLWVNAWICRIW